MSTIEVSTPETAEISSVGGRLLAFAIDCALLGILGSVLAILFFDVFAGLGGWGLLLGFAIAVTYAGVMNSRIGGGQTLGKRVMKLKVVTRDGESLGVGAALLRAAILGLPFFANRMEFIDNSNPVIYVLQALAFFGLGFSLVYLLIFNRTTRQALHDLAVGSYVVRLPTTGTVPARIGAPRRGHLAVIATVFVLSAALPVIVAESFKKAEPFASMLALSRVLAAEPGVRSVLSAQVGWAGFFNSLAAEKVSYLNVAVTCDSRAVDKEALANRLAIRSLETYAEAPRMNRIRVLVAYGFDIGIASGWRRQNFAFSPAEWRARAARGG